MGSTAPTAGQGQSERRGRRDARRSPPFALPHKKNTSRAGGRKKEPGARAGRTAADTNKPAGCKNAAGQVVPKFLFAETRDRTVALLLSGEERFQLFGNHLIQQCRF